MVYFYITTIPPQLQKKNNNHTALFSAKKVLIGIFNLHITSYSFNSELTFAL